MKKLLYLFALLCLLVSCSSTTWFAGTLGDVYFTTDDYSPENGTDYVNNTYNNLKSTLWMHYSGVSAPKTTGNKVLFYCDLDEQDFFNEYVPDEFRATKVEEAGFVLIAEEADRVFYSTYTGNVSVYYGTGVLSLYSIKTGELLYTGTVVKGPTPPETISVYVGTTSVTWDTPSPSAFRDSIRTICRNLAKGKIRGSKIDEDAIIAAGYDVPKKAKKGSIKGVWEIQGEGMYSGTQVAFSNKGFAITNGSMNFGNYNIEEETLYIDGSSYDYWFEDGMLYIADKGFLGEYETVALKRISSSGNDTSSFEKLTSRQWEYSTVGDPESGNIYNFKSNGTYTDDYHYKSSFSPQKNGTFSYSDHIIRLSTGTELTFAIIDDFAFGFSF